MKTVKLLYSLVLTVMLCSSVLAQSLYERKVVKVPKVSPDAITIDGKMDEAAWQNAAHADVVTSAGYEMYTNKYGRPDLEEPDYDELYARMLWAKDTLYLFVHIDEFVNDSTNLFWAGKWAGDQLFISINNKLGLEYAPEGQYNGNIFTYPDGPYYFLVMGDQLTLNGGDTVDIPVEYRRNPDDTTYTRIAVDPYTHTRMAVTIDTLTGVWNLEFAIYNPSVAAQSKIGFNFGGSTGSRQSQETTGDAYAYWTWQANVKDDPYAVPPLQDVLAAEGYYGDPGTFNLATTRGQAVLEFEGSNEEFQRQVVDVPMADSGAVVIDGVMDEAAWASSAKVDVVSDAGYHIFTNKYGRPDLEEPDYDQLNAHMLWSQDTLYLFLHIDEFVNDSTNLFWAGKWAGDQLFVSVSNRLGLELEPEGQYNGNAFTYPDGPYYFLIMGDQLTLNGGDSVQIPEGYRRFDDDTVWTSDRFDPDRTRMAVSIDTLTGIWNIEMAIYNPAVTYQSALGLNFGGSTGSRQSQETTGDAYAYWTWQANVPDDPYANPPFLDVLAAEGYYGDPGVFNLATSRAHAVLNFVKTLSTSVTDRGGNTPVSFNLAQNYPNPFNPSTTINFQVANQGPVYLKIYNIVGQEVASLINGEVLSAGNYSAQFNASKLASGVYFYQLKAGDFSLTRKMMLLK